MGKVSFFNELQPCKASGIIVMSGCQEVWYVRLSGVLDLFVCHFMIYHFVVFLSHTMIVSQLDL